MMTGYEVEEILQKCKDEGAYTVMHKPFNLKDLHSVIIQAEELAKK